MQDLMDSANSDLLPKLQNFDKSYKVIILESIWILIYK